MAKCLICGTINLEDEAELCSLCRISPENLSAFAGASLEAAVGVVKEKYPEDFKKHFDKAFKMIRELRDGGA